MKLPVNSTPNVPVLENVNLIMYNGVNLYTIGNILAANNLSIETVIPVNPGLPPTLILRKTEPKQDQES